LRVDFLLWGVAFSSRVMGHLVLHRDGFKPSATD